MFKKKKQENKMTKFPHFDENGKIIKLPKEKE